MRRFLLQMAGESGAGKSTLALAIGARTRAVVIDKDDITAPLIDEGVLQLGGGGPGYAVFFKLADSLLGQGFSVVLDSPAFWETILSRGKDLAVRHGANYRIVECRCPNRAEQELRLEEQGRQTGQPRSRAELAASLSRPGIMLAASEPHLMVDTTRPLEVCLQDVLEYLG